MNVKIQHFTQLHSWQKCHDLVLLVYKLTSTFPQEELFNLTHQLRAAASSITGNLARGYGLWEKEDKMAVFTKAKGKVSELQNLLVISRDLGYVQVGEYDECELKCQEGFKLIGGILKSVSQFKSQAQK